MKIKFSPYYIKYTNFLTDIEVNKDSVGDCLEHLFNQYPQLLVALLENGSKLANKTAFKLNDEYIFEVKDVYRKVGAEDVLEFTDDIPEGEGAVGKIIAGVVLIAVGAILTYTGVGGPVGSYMVNLGAAFVLGGAAEAIIGTPKLPSFDNSGSTSNTYTFSGIRNSTVSGTPIGVVYGTHRVGGHLLNAYTRSRGDSTYLYAQIGLCEGEIQQVLPSSIEINNRPVENFPDVVALWRNGTNSQSELGSASILYRPDELESENDFIYNPPLSMAWTTSLSYEFVIPNNMAGTPATYVDVSFVFWHGNMDSRIVFYDNVTGGLLSAPPIEVVASSSDQVHVKSRGNFPGTTNDIKVIITSLSIGTKVKTLKVMGYTIGTAATAIEDPAPWMSYFNTIENSTSYGLEVVNATEGEEGTIVTTSVVVDSAILTVKAPAMYSNGGQAPATVNYTVKYRLYTEDVVKNAWQISATTSISGLSKSAATKTTEINFPSPGKYDILVVRDNAATKNNNLLSIDDIFVDTLNEIVNEKLIYPNTALLGMRILASEQVNGSFPNITSVVQGKKVRLPVNYSAVHRTMTGAFTGVLKDTKEWTDNPVWCLYDFLTDERYGAGKRFKIAESKKGLMLANFQLMAQYCDVRLREDGTAVTDYTSAEWFTARPRFSLNLVIDEIKDVTEWVNTICATFRAVWFYSEGVFWLDIDRPKTMSQIFNMSNIKEFTKFSTSNRETPNSFEIQFRNAKKDFDNDVIVFEDTDIQSDLTIDEVKKNIQLIGVTDDRQIKSLAKYYIDSSKNLQTGCTFKTGTHALQSLVTDVIGVQHDVPQWGFGGVVEAYNSGTRELTVSSPVTFANGKNYSIKISHKGGIPETVAITEVYDNQAHSSFVLTTAPSFNPESGDTYSLGETGYEVKPFKIINISSDEDDSYTVSCVEYNSAVFDNADNISNMGTIIPRPYSALSPATGESVRNVVAQELIYEDTSGQTKTGVEIYYTRPDSSFWKGVYVYYRAVPNEPAGRRTQVRTEGWYKTELNSTGYVFIPEILSEGTYSFVLVSVYPQHTQSLNEALNDTVNQPYAYLDISPFVPNDVFLGGISGLQIVGQPNSNEFYTKDCKFSWNRIATIDYAANTIAGLEVNGASSQSNSWFKEYIVEILNQDGSVRRSAKVYSEEYLYTHEMNHQDGISRYFSIRITAVDRLGRKSASKQLDVSNPAPSAIS